MWQCMKQPVKSSARGKVTRCRYAAPAPCPPDALAELLAAVTSKGLVWIWKMWSLSCSLTTSHSSTARANLLIHPIGVEAAAADQVSELW
jgi:hypothetical protein